jgi:flagellar protein FliJ
MKQFSFSLSTLLRVRKYKEEIAQKKLLEKYLILQKAMVHLEALYQEYYQTKDEVRTLQKDLRDISALTALYEYIDAMKRRIENQKKVVSDAKIVVEMKRKEVVHAMQQRKIIENLRQKKLTEWEIEINDEERKIFDELATMRFDRKKNKL